jgi:hypothetical protein
MPQIKHTYVKANADLVIEEVELPVTYGNISGYQFQGEAVHRKDGFIKAQIITPDYNAETHRVVDVPWVYDSKKKVYVKALGLEQIVPPEATPEPTDEELWMDILEERFYRLQLCDWVDNAPVRNKESHAYLKGWDDYRQALRDITTDFSDPRDVVWPTAPHSPVLGKNYAHGTLREGARIGNRAAR